MVPWSPRRWLAHHVGCQPAQLHLVAHSDTDDGTAAVTYRTPEGELVTVLAVVEGGFWRVSARQGDRWLRAETAAESGLLW